MEYKTVNMRPEKKESGKPQPSVASEGGNETTTDGEAIDPEKIDCGGKWLDICDCFALLNSKNGLCGLCAG